MNYIYSECDAKGIKGSCSKEYFVYKKYFKLTIGWFLVAGVSYLLNLDVRMLHLVLAVFVYWVIGSKSIYESFYAMILLSTGPVDELIYIGSAFILLKLLFQKKVYISASYYGYAYVIFCLVAILSVLIGYISVEFRPIQTILWCFTFLIPISLFALKTFDISQNGASLISKYFICIIILQIIPVLFQLPARIETGNVDLMAGSWGDADILGFWGSALFIAVAMRLFRRVNGYFSEDGRLRDILFVLFLALILMILPDSKVYSGSILIVSTIVISILMAKKLILGSYLPIIWFFCVIGLGVFLNTYVEGDFDTKKEFATNIKQNSKKVEFLSRVFFGEMSSLQHMVGSGPGMLGSRAANSVSGDVLYKSEHHVPAFMVNAPQPVRKYMRDLWDEDLATSIKWMSANLVMPFSGIGAIKGELGWVGLICFLAMIILIAVKFINIPVYGFYEYLLCQIVWIALLGCVFLSIFDTVWEMPKLTAPIGLLIIVAHVIRGSALKVR